MRLQRTVAGKPARTGQCGTPSQLVSFSLAAEESSGEISSGEDGSGEDGSGDESSGDE